MPRAEFPSGPIRRIDRQPITRRRLRTGYPATKKVKSSPPCQDYLSVWGIEGMNPKMPNAVRSGAGKCEAAAIWRQDRKVRRT